MSRFRRHPVVSVFLFALTVRLGAAIVLQHALDHRLQREFLVPGDSQGYWLLAGSLLRGDAYRVHQPPRHIHRVPGFPLLLAAARRLSADHPLATRCLLAVVATAGSALVCWWGCALFGSAVGWLAGLWTAVAPLPVAFSVSILSEMTFATSLLLNLICGWRWLRELRAGSCIVLSADGSIEPMPRPTSAGSGHRQYVWAMLTGVTGAWTALVRPGWLPAIPAFLLLVSVGTCLRQKHMTRQALAGSLLALAACSLVLLPWVLRNHRVSGHFVVTSLWSGPSLYDGLNPAADGSSDMRFFDEDRLMLRMSEYDMNREYTRRAWAFVRSNPQRAVELAGLKQLRFWSPWLNAEEFSSPLVNLVTTLFWLSLILGGLWGVFLFRREGWLLLLTAGPVVYFAVLHTVFVGSVRYRVPVEYPFAILSAAGWLSLGKSRSWTWDRRSLSAVSSPTNLSRTDSSQIDSAQPKPSPPESLRGGHE